MVDLKEAVFPEVLAGFGHEHTGKPDHADEVRQSHETVGEVGKVPDDAALGDDAAHKDNDDPDYAVGIDETAATQVFQGAFAEIGPAQHGGNNEGGQADGEHPAAEAAQRSKGNIGEQLAIISIDVVVCFICFLS